MIPESDFCHVCGAKIIRKRLTIKNLFEHFAETYFNYDNKLLRTFVDLFKRPEAVIEVYINGVRKRYVNVISYFTLALTLTGIYIIIMNKFFPNMMDYSVFVQPGQEEFQKKNMQFIQEYSSIVNMLYVPIYAIMAKITFLGLKKYNYTELLVIFLYVQAQISIAGFILNIAGAVCGIKAGTVGLVYLPLMFVYTAFVLKRLYKLDFLNIFARTLLFLFVLGIFMAILSVGMFVNLYLNGELESFIEASKAARGN